MRKRSLTPQPPTGFWHGLYQQLRHFDRTALHPGIALRNSLGVALALILAARFGTKIEAMIAALGALTVCFSDGRDPYLPRVKRMLLSALGCAGAVVAGALIGEGNLLRVLASGLWAFPAGLLVALGPVASDLATFSLVALIIFAAVPAPLPTALHWGTLALAGGALQAVLACLLWPLDQHQPERRQIAELYRALAEVATRPPLTRQTPAAANALTSAQVAFASYEESPESPRFRSLLNQAERIRLRLFWLWRLRNRWEREGRSAEGLALLDAFREETGKILRQVSQAVVTRNAPKTEIRCSFIDDIVEKARALPAEIASVMSALAGQLRAASDLASGGQVTSGPVGERALGRSRRLHTLYANLTPRSAAFRHAVRLALCVGVGEALAWILPWHRAYWLPMTAAIVLRPEFSATIARGTLRIGGTLIGLLLSTVLFHRYLPGFGGEVLLTTAFTALLRYYGPANYGLGTVSLSGLVVTLLAISGVAPSEVMVPRAINTLLGGALAMIVYRLYPTWSGPQVARTLSRTLRAYGEYTGAVGDPRAPETERDRLRLAGRVARSNFDLSCLQYRAEPGTPIARRGWVSAVGAAGNRVAHALLALEAAGAPPVDCGSQQALAHLLSDAALTLTRLADALDGPAPTSFPDLRDDFEKLGPGLPPEWRREADRLTNSLNTLREKVLQHARGRV